MKKLFSILLIVVMMCSMLSMTAFADAGAEVVSPEHNNTDVEADPVSTQTGYAATIAGVAVIALACGTVAVISAKKARE